MYSHYLDHNIMVLGLAGPGLFTRHSLSSGLHSIGLAGPGLSGPNTRLASPARECMECHTSMCQVMKG